MDFDPSSAKEIGWYASFDPSSATEVKQFDPTTAEPVKPKLTVSQEISPIQPKSQKNLVDRNAPVPTPGQELDKDIRNRLVGTGIDIADLVASIGPQAMSYIESIRLGTQGKGSEEAGKAMEEIRHSGMLREQNPSLKEFPANPAIEGIMEKISQGIKLATDKAFGPDPTPGKIAAEDALMIALLGGAAKGLQRKPAAEAPKTDANIIAEKLKPNLTDVNASDARSPYQSGAIKNLPPDATNQIPPDAVKAKPPDSTISKGALNKNRVEEINQFNEEAFKNNTGQSIMGSQLDLNPNAKGLNEPYWLDQDLQKAIESANRSAQARENFKNPYDAPVDISRDGGGMDAVFPDRAVVPIPNTQETPDPTTDGVVSKMVPDRYKDIQTNAKLANELSLAKNLSEAVTTVRKYLKDPDQQGVAEVLQRFVSEDTRFQAMNPEDVASYGKDSALHGLNDAIGLHITTPSGNQFVAVRGMKYFLEIKKADGLNPEVVLHEAVHSVTDKAFFVASHPELIKDPKYANHVAYAGDMHDLMSTVAKEMKPEDVNHFAEAFENAAEFNAYGWTSPAFRDALSKIELKTYGKNAWERFKDLVKQFFGKDIKTTNALEAINGFMDRLDYIDVQHKADVGKAVQRLNDLGVEAISESKKTDRLRMQEGVDKVVIEDNESLITSLFTDKVWTDLFNKQTSVNQLFGAIKQTFAYSNTRKPLLKKAINEPKIKKQLEFYRTQFNDGAMVPQDVRDVLKKYNFNTNNMFEVSKKLLSVRSDEFSRIARKVMDSEELTLGEQTATLLSLYKYFKVDPLRRLPELTTSQWENIFKIVREDPSKTRSLFSVHEDLQRAKKANFVKEETPNGVWYSSNDPNFIQSIAAPEWCLSRGYAPNYTQEGHFIDIYVPKDQSFGNVAVVHKNGDIVEVQDRANNRSISPDSKSILEESAFRTRMEDVKKVVTERTAQVEDVRITDFKDNYNTGTNKYWRQTFDLINNIIHDKAPITDLARINRSPDVTVLDDGTFRLNDINAIEYSWDLENFLTQRNSKGEFKIKSDLTRKRILDDLTQKVWENTTEITAARIKIDTVLPEDSPFMTQAKLEKVIESGLLESELGQRTVKIDKNKFPKLQHVGWVEVQLDYWLQQALFKPSRDVVNGRRETPEGVRYSITTYDPTVLGPNAEIPNKKLAGQIKNIIKDELKDYNVTAIEFNIDQNYQKDRADAQIGYELMAKKGAYEPRNNEMKPPPSRLRYEGGWISFGRKSAKELKEAPKTADELKMMFPLENTDDLNPFTGKNIFTGNQVKNIVKHPWVDFVWEKTNTIIRQEELKQAARRDVYNEFVKPIKEDELIKIEKAIVDATVEPYEVRAQVEAGGMPAIVEYYKSKGLTETEANKAAALQSILRDVEGSDRGMASLLGRTWQHQPLYAPLSHGGRFRVLATDQNGDVVMARGYHKASDAAKFYTEFKKELAKDKSLEGITLENVKRSDVNSLKSDMAELMLSQALPDYLKKQVQSVEKTMEVSRRKFEMERRAKLVSGYVGEELGDPKTGYGRRQQQALIDSFEARIDASFDFGVKARIAKEILDPLLSDPSVQSLRPELYNYLNQLVMRQMGFPIAVTKSIDNGLQAFADKSFGKPMNTLSNILHGLEPNDVSMLSPKAVESIVQTWTYATSLAKLGWNLSTWAANATAIPMVSFEGWRVAHKERVSPWYAVLAASDSRQFALGMGDTSAKKFMEQAKREGMVDALISDTYTLDPSARRTKLDQAVNAPRDVLEYATNYNTIQYFYHFYKRLYNDQPNKNLKIDETSEAFKTKVYEAARSWTGDYSAQATPLALSQAGIAGRAAGNFAKWRFNQLGRLVDDVSTIKDNPTSGHAWGALMALLVTQTLMGGIYGLVGVADYEAVRRFGQWTGAFELRPFSMYYEDIQKKLDGAIPDWMRRGAITAASDAVAQQFGEESGPDLSGSLRYSSFIEPPTVAFKYFIDVYKGVEWVGKRSLQAAGYGDGVTHQESKDAINALPTAARNIMQDYFKERIERDGKEVFITQQRKLDKGNFEQNNFQRNLDKLGLKTRKENDFNDQVFATEWLKKHNAKQITEHLAKAINWAIEPQRRSYIDQTGINDPDQVVIEKNLNSAYQIGGMTTLREFKDQLKNKPLDRNTTYDQRLVMDALKQQDPIRKKILLQELEKFMALKESRNTSLSR